ncbi:pilus assembly protein Flp/PilA [Burkholderia sp. D7]|nr:pilus assembly protein Flp/PilA [Burkholderia sp. D7]
MQSLINSTKAFIRDEDGVTSIEYGLMAALIAVAIITAVKLVATELNATFGTVSTALTPPAA